MNRILGVLLVLAALSGIGEAWAGEIRLMAAASLKEVLNELADSYARRNAGASFTKSYGASGMLAKQVENGAPADIFISANREWVDYLKGKNLLAGQPVIFAGNTLVCAGTANAARGMKDLPKLGRIAIGSPKSVPAGEYAVEAMKKAGIDKEMAAKIVMAKDVRECLVYAERGEVEGAFVYRTDALQSKKTRILFTVPQELYERVVYPAAITAAADKREEVAAFFRYLQSEEARKVLVKYGFVPK